MDEQCTAAGKPGPGEGEEGGGGGVTAERDPGAAAGEGRHGSEPSDPNGREHSSARESEGETLNDIKKQVRRRPLPCVWSKCRACGGGTRQWAAPSFVKGSLQHVYVHVHVHCIVRVQYRGFPPTPS